MKKGFTLVEIMIVVAVIGILAGLAVPSIITAREDAVREVCTSNIRTIQEMLEIAAFDNGIDTRGLDTPDIQTAIVPTYLKIMPVCKDGGVYYTTSDGIVFCYVHTIPWNDAITVTPIGYPMSNEP